MKSLILVAATMLMSLSAHAQYGGGRDWDRGGRGGYDDGRGDWDRGGGWGRETVVTLDCSSNGYGESVCDAGGQITRIVSLRQNSKTACVQGDTYFVRGSSIIVTKGCRATFQVAIRERGGGGPGRPGPGPGYPPPGRPGPGPGYPPPGNRIENVSCASVNYGRRDCYVNGNIRDVILIRQDSRSSCQGAYSWGQNYISVDRGCAGVFQVTYW